MQAVQKVGAEEQLALRPQWVCWKHVGREKVPVSPHTGRRASTTDPSTWTVHPNAVGAAGNYDGIGYVVSADDPYTFVDLDDCIDEYGEVATWAIEIVEALDSYTEVTPSGRGLRVWVIGRKLGSKCKRDYETGKVEIYDAKQFSTFTGKCFQGHSVEYRQRELDELYMRVFGDDNQTDKHGVDARSGSGFHGSDDELLGKARANATTGDTFRRLYDNGDVRGFHSASEADLRLCTILAFWCGPDVDRIDAFFRRSSLMREKWDTSRGSNTYGEQTIRKGIQGCSYFYDSEYTSKSKNQLQTELRNLSEWLLSQPWSGRSGPTDRDVYKAMIRHAWKYGKLHADGVEMAISERDAAPDAGTSQAKTVRRAFERLENKHGVVRRLDNGGPRKASRFLLKRHEPTPYIQRVYKYGVTLCRKLRHPSEHVATIGKRNGQILDFVYSLQRVVTLDELAEHLQVKRSRSIKNRNINLLLEEELLEERDGGYVTAEDIEMRLARFLNESGHDEAEKLQRERIQREREAFRNRTRPQAAPDPDDVPRVYPEEQTEAVTKNIPEKSADGIHHHGPECACWLCEDEAPEYITTAINEEIAA